MSNEIPGQGGQQSLETQQHVPESILKGFSGGAYGEFDPNYEVIRSGGPESVRHAVRAICAKAERSTMFYEAAPNSWVMNTEVDVLRNRAHGVRFSYPLGLVEWPSYLKGIKSEPMVGPNGELEMDAEGNLKRKYFLKEDPIVKDPVAREKYWKEILKYADEMDARLSLMEKLKEMSAFETDLDEIAITAFTRAGKIHFWSSNVAEIANAVETEEGFGRYGRMVDEGVKAFVRVGEGEAKVVTGKDAQGQPVEKRIPNLFGSQVNHGLMEWVIDNYVVPEIEKAVPAKLSDKQDGNDELWKEYLRWDRKSAAITALELIKLGNVDTTYAYSFNEFTGLPVEKGAIKPSEFKDVNLNTDPLWGGYDWAKLHIELRRLKEHGKTAPHLDEKGEPVGPSRKEHIRVAGALASLGCYPTLFFNAYEVAFFEIPVFDPNDPNNLPDLNVKEKLAKGVKVLEKKTASVWEVLKGKKTAKRFVFNKNGQLVTEEYAIPATHLDEIDWDTAMPINIDQPGKELDFLHGVKADWREIPWGLGIFYATKYMFDVFVNSDYLKVYKEVVESDLLMKMNKAIDLALVFICKAKNIPDETRDKLNNYIRTVFIGSLWVATARPGIFKNDELEKNAISGSSTDEAPAETALITAAARTSFLPIVNGKMTRGSVEGKWINLFDRIKKDRQAPLPGDSGIFTPEELEQLKPLYPLGLTRNTPQTP